MMEEGQMNSYVFRWVRACWKWNIGKCRGVFRSSEWEVEKDGGEGDDVHGWVRVCWARFGRIGMYLGPRSRRGVRRVGEVAGDSVCG